MKHAAIIEALDDRIRPLGRDIGGAEWGFVELAVTVRRLACVENATNEPVRRRVATSVGSMRAPTFAAPLVGSLSLSAADAVEGVMVSGDVALAKLFAPQRTRMIEVTAEPGAAIRVFALQLVARLMARRPVTVGVLSEERAVEMRTVGRAWTSGTADVLETGLTRTVTGRIGDAAIDLASRFGRIEPASITRTTPELV